MKTTRSSTVITARYDYIDPKEVENLQVGKLIHVEK